MLFPLPLIACLLMASFSLHLLAVLLSCSAARAALEYTVVVRGDVTALLSSVERGAPATAAVTTWR